MPELPRVGESLDRSATLEAKSRRYDRSYFAGVCSRCKTSPYPRGFVVNLGLCWWCAFPLPGEERR